MSKNVGASLLNCFVVMLKSPKIIKENGSKKEQRNKERYNWKYKRKEEIKKVLVKLLA